MKIQKSSKNPKILKEKASKKHPKITEKKKKSRNQSLVEYNPPESKVKVRINGNITRGHNISWTIDRGV